MLVLLVVVADCWRLLLLFVVLTATAACCNVLLSGAPVCARVGVIVVLFDVVAGCWCCRRCIVGCCLPIAG